MTRVRNTILQPLQIDVRTVRVVAEPNDHSFLYERHVFVREGRPQRDVGEDLPRAIEVHTRGSQRQH